MSTAVASGPSSPGLGTAQGGGTTAVGNAAPASVPDQGMPGVAGQLVRVLAPPRPTADGTYTVTVSLRPASLGTVQATVTAGPDRVAVSLSPSTTEGAEAISQALPQLHEALASGGQQASVSLAGGSVGSQSHGAGQSVGQDGSWRPPGGGQSWGSAGGAPGGGASGGGGRSGSGSMPSGAPAVTRTGTGSSTTVPRPGHRGDGPQRLLDVRV